jgi:hypothetical protein
MNNLILNTENKKPVFLFVIIAIAMIAFLFMQNYLNKTVNNIRLIADIFMYNLKNQKFDSIDNVLNKNIDLKVLLTEII